MLYIRFTLAHRIQHLVHDSLSLYLGNVAKEVAIKNEY